MLEKFYYKYLKNAKSYLKTIKANLRIFAKNPIYYLKEYLRIIGSLFLVIIRKFPNLRINNIIRKVNGVNFNFDFKFGAVIRGMYLRFFSADIVNTMLKYIKKGSTFIDIGANIGYITAIGAGCVGKKGQVHSFEPVPLYFNKLIQLKLINKNYKIYINNFALGERESNAEIYTSRKNPGWNTMISGWIDPDDLKNKIKIKVKRLDKYLFEKKINNISLIKIDVEGFEIPVLKGMTKFFEENKDSLPPIILEVIPSTYSLLGNKLEDLENLLKKFSYIAYSIDEKKKIKIKI